MGTSGYVMPPKCQLSPQDIDEIAAGFHQVNALRALSKKFKIGQGRIRRIWAGVAYRASLIDKKVMVELTHTRLNEMLAIEILTSVFAELPSEIVVNLNKL